jgi:hypothetical protein
MATTGPNLGITISDTAGAAGWDSWMNVNLGMLDAVVFLDVIERELATPPGSPSAGDRYLIGSSATGAWSGHDGEIAVYRGGSWVFYTPLEGWLMTSQDDPGKLYKYEGSAFVEISGTAAYDVAAMKAGEPGASEVILRFIATRAFRLPQNLTGSQAKAAVAADASTTFAIKKNGSDVGSFNFAGAATSATFTMASDTDFAAGDVLTIVAPGSPDADLADIAVTLKGALL